MASSAFRGTAPPLHSPRPLQQLPAAAAASASQQRRRCRAERAGSFNALVEHRLGRRRQGLHSVSPPSPSPPLSASSAPPRRPAAPVVVAASASRRAAAAAAVVQSAPLPSLFDPAAASEAIKAFFARALPAPPPSLPSSLAAAAAAAAALPPARRDALAALATAIGAYALVKFFDKVATRGWLDQKLTRKLVHTLAGPLFVASWPLFSGSESARWFAAAVPLLNGLRLVLAGTGVTSSEGSVRSMTRHGDRSELLRGPLYYVIALVAATLAFWRQSPAAALVVASMCGGDGLADIVGRRAPPRSPRIPWNADKTLRGSAAMFAASLAFAVALVWLFAGFGYFGVVSGGGGGGASAAAAGFAAAPPPPAASAAAASAAAAASSSSPSLSSTLFASFSAQRAAASALAPPTVAALAAASLAATAVESLPANRFVDDNVSVPAVAAALGWWLFERSC